MTDRVNMLYVALDKDIRTDDIKALVNAISQLNHVLSVKNHVKEGFDAWVEEERANRKWRDKLWQLIKDDREAKSDTI